MTDSQVRDEVIWLPDIPETHKSLLRNEDDFDDVITIDEDEEDEKTSIDGDLPQTLKCYYLTDEQKKNHAYIDLIKDPADEDEDVDIEDAVYSSCDSDVEEIIDPIPDPIVIPDDDESDEVIIVSPPITNGTDSSKRIKYNEASLKTQAKRSRSEPSANWQNNRKAPQESSRSPEDASSDCVITSSASIVPLPKRTGSTFPRLAVGAVTTADKNGTPKFVLQPALSSNGNIIPFKSAVGSEVCLRTDEGKVILKTVSQRSLLKVSQKRPATTVPQNGKARKSITKTVDIEPPGHVCHECGFCFSSPSNLQMHIETSHERELYTRAGLEELERELKDQSRECPKCRTGYNYLPRIAAHMTEHPARVPACDTCGYGLRIIKHFMEHLEHHASNHG